MVTTASSLLREKELPLEEKVQVHLSTAQTYLAQITAESICNLANVLNQTRKQNRTIFILGNGGSATTAMHMANDFSRVFDSENKPLNVNCLNANMSTFSALANDYGYENVFTQQMYGVIQKGDVVIGISASGNSPNCVAALSLAKESGATVIGLLGFSGGKMKELSDYFIHTPVNDYFIVENVHLAISHALTFALRSLC